MTKQLTMMVVLEAKPEKAAELAAMLDFVTKASRDEDYCIDYRLHRSLENPNQFVLYEVWKSAELHELQFEKPYIKCFMAKAEELLAKPFQAISAEEI